MSFSSISLRTITYKDINNIFQIRSHYTYNKYLNFKLYTNIKEAKQLVEDVIYDSIMENIYFWMIDDKNGNTVGNICLWNYDIKNNQIEIGYELHHAYYGLGYMKEALPLVIEYASNVLNISRITAYTAIDNERSYSLLRKNDFFTQGKVLHDDIDSFVMIKIL